MTFEFTFNHPIEQVFELLTTPQFVVDRCLAIDSLSAECEVIESEQDTQVNIQRVQESDVPKLIKKVVGEQQDVDIKEVWSKDGEHYRCQVDTQIKGAPISIHLDKNLISTTSGCSYSAEVTAKCSAPIIGRKIEKLAAEKVPETLQLECEYLENYLDKHCS